MTTLPDATPFSLCGGHPVLDLVNTFDNRFRADGPTELLPDYAALLRFMEQTGLLDAAQVRALARRVTNAEAEQSLESAHDLREAAASTLYATAEGFTPQLADVRKLARY